MKKAIFTVVACCMFAVSAFAQKSADFSGTWSLDVSKSKLDERARIESMTMTVTQSAKDIKVETSTKRAPRPEGAPGGMGGGGGGMGRGGGFGTGDASNTYTLDGKESTIQQEGPNGAIPVVLKGTLDGEKLNLSSSRTFNGPQGSMTATTKEAWTLSADSKTLTVERESQNPRGAQTSTMVFSKK